MVHNFSLVLAYGVFADPHGRAFCCRTNYDKMREHQKPENQFGLDAELIKNLSKFDSQRGCEVENLFSCIHDRFEYLMNQKGEMHSYIYEYVSNTWGLLNILQNLIPNALFEDLDSLMDDLKEMNSNSNAK